MQQIMEMQLLLSTLRELEIKKLGAFVAPFFEGESFMKESKELISFICTTYEAFHKCMKDKIIDTSDLIHLPPVIMGIIPAINGFEKVKTELKNMTYEDLDDLVSFAREEFDIDHEKLESFIENGIEWIVEGIKLFKEYEEMIASD